MAAELPTLILVPTELELRRLEDQGGFESQLGRTEICGFGAALAGARTMQLLFRHRPRRVLLVGIAGAYDVATHPVGEALAFSEVAVDGIGTGEGARFQGPVKLGFPQWPGSARDPAEERAEPGSPAIEESVALACPAGVDDGLLLTTCAASDSAEHAAERRERHPTAVAEDMEAFSVAAACRLTETPLAVVRGISNLVGDRDATHWRIPGALAAAHRRALEILAAAWEPVE